MLHQVALCIARLVIKLVIKPSCTTYKNKKSRGYPPAMDGYPRDYLLDADGLLDLVDVGLHRLLLLCHPCKPIDRR